MNNEILDQIIAHITDLRSRVSEYKDIKTATEWLKCLNEIKEYVAELEDQLDSYEEIDCDDSFEDAISRAPITISGDVNNLTIIIS